MGSLDCTVPPFPNDMPTVPIARISYSKLKCYDENEMGKVLKACQSDGFFYLDLTDDPAGQCLLHDTEDILAVAKRALNIPLDKKMECLAERGKQMFGYKPAGAVKQTDKDARPDTTEFFNVSKDHLMENSESRTYPAEITNKWTDLRKFAQNCHSLGLMILRILAEQLDLPSDEFAKRNNITSISGDHIRMTKMPGCDSADGKRIGLASHTDFGSITVLFNWVGGLQIQSHDPAKQGEWAFVKPLPGHAIINLGDAMVKFSNGRLKSGKHRVVPLPEPPGRLDRYSVVYFVRPADDVLMEPVEQYKNEPVVAVGGKVGEEKLAKPVVILYERTPKSSEHR
ncbi:gibberellin 2-beta-dioxygenase 8 [Fusarium sp. NRRL 52700]|nr:gibberellin 2-beta-dioxygenase 8 [Fusarium sp. NRRL 52700]